MEQDLKIKEIAEEYDFSIGGVRSFFNILCEYPFIAEGSKEKLYNCLEFVVADRVSVQYASSARQRSVKDTIAEMIYRVYGEEALYYLNDEFLENRGIKLYDPEYNSFNGSMDLVEQQYQGWVSRVK